MIWFAIGLVAAIFAASASESDFEPGPDAVASPPDVVALAAARLAHDNPSIGAVVYAGKELWLYPNREGGHLSVSGEQEGEAIAGLRFRVIAEGAPPQVSVPGAVVLFRAIRPFNRSHAGYRLVMMDGGLTRQETAVARLDLMSCRVNFWVRGARSAMMVGLGSPCSGEGAGGDDPVVLRQTIRDLRLHCPVVLVDPWRNQTWEMRPGGPWTRARSRERTP